MNLNKPLLDHAIISKSTLDALEHGLKRLREFGGLVYRPEDPSRQTSSFWFPPPSCGFMEMQQGNTDRDIHEYQEAMRLYKLARAALTAMSQSLELEIYKLREKMQPVVISRGIANIPDEILGNILSLYLEPCLESTYYFNFRYILRTKQVCKRFSNIIDKDREIWSYLTNGMRPEEIDIRLQRSGAVGLKIYLTSAGSAWTSFLSTIKTLLPHAARWQELSLSITSGKNLDVFGKLDSQNHFPKLRELAITNISYGRLNFDDGVPYRSWNMPQLRQLSFKDDLLVPTAARITSLDLRVTMNKWRLENLHHALDSLSATLTSLRVGFSSVQLDGNDNLTVLLPHLRTMQLDFSFDGFDDKCNGDKWRREEYGEHVSRTFYISLFETRKLERLTVSLSSGDWLPWDTNVLLYDLSKWQCASTALRYLNLIHAKLQCSCGPKIDILKVLRNLSDIEFIYVTNIYIEYPQPSSRWDYNRGAMLDAFSEATSCLRQLHLRGCMQTKEHIEELMQILTDSAVFPRFERLVLSNCTGFTWEELAGLKGLEYLVICNE